MTWGASDNRFAVLHPKEPAPGVLEKRESTLPLDPSFGRERPMTLSFQTNIISTDRPSSSKDESLAPTSSPTPGSNRPSTPRLSRTSPSISAPIESKQQPSTLAAASVPRTKPLAQPPPLVLQLGAQAAQSPMLSSPPNLISLSNTIAATHFSILTRDAAPSLPSPPIPPDPMATPSLASLPIPPCFDFKHLTSPQSCEPANGQFSPPKPTSCDIFGKDDSAHHIVKTTSGKIFWMAAEIAAANERSKMKPVGKVLISKPAQKTGKVKGKIDRKKLNRKCGEYVGSREDTEDESEEDGEGEEWLGKEEHFVRNPSFLCPFTPLFESEDTLEK